MVDPAGVEPATSCLQGRRSSQKLSYGPIESGCGEQPPTLWVLYAVEAGIYKSPIT